MSLTSTDIIQIAVGSVTATALIITAFSYFLSRRAYKKQYEYNKKLKSLEIADTMAVLISSDISKILEPFNGPKLKAFLNDYFATDQYSLPFDYSALQERCEKAPLLKYGDVASFYKKYKDLILEYYYQKRINNGESTTDATNNARHDFNEHSWLFCLTLNKIESVAMYFCTNIADESVAYPSIHQVFLKLIKISSIRISEINKTTFDEYYKHTILLYHLWNERQSIYSNSDKEIRENNNKKMIKKNGFSR